MVNMNFAASLPDRLSLEGNFGPLPGRSPACLTNRFRWICFLAVVLATFPAPIQPHIANVDGSWRYALNELHRQGKVFGRDVNFTYGPLGFAVTPLEIGDTATTATSSALCYLLHAACWVVVLGLFRHARCRLDVVVLALAAGLSRPTIMTALLVAVLGSLTLAQLRGSRGWAVYGAILAGILLLIKINVGVCAVLVVACWAIARCLVYKDVAGLFILAIAGTAGALVPFMLLGGSPIDFAAYIRDGMRLASEYSSHMALAPEMPLEQQLIAWMQLLPPAYLGWTAWRWLGLRRGNMIFHVIMIIPLFFAYKGAVTRCDPSHIQIEMAGVAGFCALLMYITDGVERTVLSYLAVSLSVCCLGLSSYSLMDSAVNVSEALTWPRTLRARQAARSALLEADVVPASMVKAIGGATVDADPDETLMILANGLKWRPRPMFQTYQVSSPATDERNAEVYRGTGGAGFVLYRFESINERNPFLNDPLTVRALVTHFEPIEDDGKTLLLRRRAVPRQAAERALGESRFRLGEEVKVPDVGDALLLARIQLRLRRQGAVLAAFYRVVPPRIAITYLDGRVVEHSLPWRNAAAGLPINSVPVNFVEARRFLAGDMTVCRVRSFRIMGNLQAFEPDYGLSWSRYDLDPTGSKAPASAITGPTERQRQPATP